MLYLAILLVAHAQAYRITSDDAAAHIVQPAKMLVFPADFSPDNFIKLKPDFSALGAGVSVCSWIYKFLDSSTPRIFFSYATERDTNEIALPDDLSYLDETFPALEAFRWYHYCFTLDSKSLKLAVVIDGEQVVQFPIPPGSSIQDGGTLVLGQEQDSLGGDFDASQAFAGKLYELNVYKRRLSTEEMMELSKDRCSMEMVSSLRADIVLSWSDILGEKAHGTILTEPRGDCKKLINSMERSIIDDAK